MKRTLGTQLRHLIELLDGAVTRSYEQIGLNYRPRYTPIMRILINQQSCTIGDIAALAKLTQPAATQTIALMLKDGIVRADSGEKDGRKKVISLTEHGLEMIPALQQCWNATAQAAQSIEDELPHSLTHTLELAIKALENKSFDLRIEEARKVQKAQTSKSVQESTLIKTSSTG